MAITPPPNSGGSPIRSSHNGALLDTIWGVYAPALLLFLIITILSSSFGLRAPMVKGIGSLILCGISVFFLFLTAKNNGCTAIRWRFSLSDWAQLALTVHALYFGVIHDLVSK